MDFNVACVKIGHALHGIILKTLCYSEKLKKIWTQTINKCSHTFAMSYMTEILNSQSMKVSSGYEILSLSTYWKNTDTKNMCKSELNQCMVNFKVMLFVLLYAPSEILALRTQTLQEPHDQSLLYHRILLGCNNLFVIAEKKVDQRKSCLLFQIHFIVSRNIKTSVYSWGQGFTYT